MNTKKRVRRYGWLTVLALLVPVGAYGLMRWQVWDAYYRVHTWNEWSVLLPQGGSLTYRNQSPRLRLAGPADTNKILVWQQADGRTHEYHISDYGGGYRDIEMKMRPDGTGVYLVAWDWKEVVAALDFKNNLFVGEGGVIYEPDGTQNTEREGFPAWANLREGRSLGHKKFS